MTLVVTMSDGSLWYPETEPLPARFRDDTSFRFSVDATYRIIRDLNAHDIDVDDLRKYLTQKRLERIGLQPFTRTDTPDNKEK